MEHLVPVVVVSLIVAFLMYKNINKITANMDNFESKSYIIYAKYSRIVERYIKNLQNIIEKNSVLSDKKYELKKDVNPEKLIDELSSLVRRLAFFETLQAKKKSKKELESDFFEILSSFDQIIKENFSDGEKLADEIREDLHQEYLNLTSNV